MKKWRNIKEENKNKIFMKNINFNDNNNEIIIYIVFEGLNTDFKPLKFDREDTVEDLINEISDIFNIDYNYLNKKYDIVFGGNNLSEHKYLSLYDLGIINESYIFVRKKKQIDLEIMENIIPEAIKQNMDFKKNIPIPNNKRLMKKEKERHLEDNKLFPRFNPKKHTEKQNKKNNRINECYVEEKEEKNNIKLECYVEEKEDYFENEDYVKKELYIENDHYEYETKEKNKSKRINIIINIKFIKQPYIKKENNYYYQDLYGLLKLSLLKEISSKLDIFQLKQLPNIISSIMKILKNGYVELKNDKEKECIKEVLEKLEGSNIINFSNYVNEIITDNELINILNILEENDLKEIIDIMNRLSNYNKHMKFFEKSFKKAQERSIFEYSIISLVIIERKDFNIFERERKKCPNRVSKILYHGTTIPPICNILTDMFKRSEKVCIYGKGIYFTSFLDYCWYYAGNYNGNIRCNFNKIPKITETFSMVSSLVYFNREGFRHVYDDKYTPKKNEINFGFADCTTRRIKGIDKSKFYGTEFVVWDFNQICPFISATLERKEFCVIWRDINFSPNPIYNNNYDKIFKEFLHERMKYINEMSKFNIYTFENSEDALKVIERKKYNKIILISNVGTDLAGKEFITNARKILGNDIIALFLAYSESHLEWIKDYKNAIFSNDPKFYEKYLECFVQENIEESILDLKEEIEYFYDVKFNFDEETFLYFPYFKENGKFSDLEFNKDLL